MAELWDLYNEDREKIGQTMERGKPIPEGCYHLVVHVCIFDSSGRMLIQQRQPFKEGWSNMWDLTTGGSAVAGDSSRTAAEREVLEELGYPLSLENERPALTIHFDGGFDDIYCIKRDIDISSLKLQYEEVQTVKWADKEEILSMIDSGEFIPYHKSLIDLLFLFSTQRGTHMREDVKG
ncbi:MAG: NUDIX domain-containing protein [Oscillospiraceae bacterium]|nr:NUDIX domain-containing protein [Oscillospiraceae bacterium]